MVIGVLGPQRREKRYGCTKGNTIISTQYDNQKRLKIQSVNYVTPDGNITVERGWWFSSHEKCKCLILLNILNVLKGSFWFYLTHQFLSVDNYL